MYTILALWSIIAIVHMHVVNREKVVNWDKVDQIIAGYIQQGAFPGAVLRIANKTHTLYSQNYGTVMRQIGTYSSSSFTKQTIFDIASLSKVTGTLAVVMQLANDGMIGIDDKVTKYIPEYANNGKQETTLKNLLLHNAGLLPDYVGDKPATKKKVMEFIYTCQLSYPIGTKFVYSDLSFILLAEICERRLGGPLEDLVRLQLGKMGILNTTYLPDQAKRYRIAPTEYSKRRGKLIWGEVHDPTAYDFGGVAGHAGIFSIAHDLVAYMQLHLNGGISATGKRIYRQEIVRLFQTRVDGLPYNNRRALGWDTVPIQPNPPCGHKFSLNSFGHTGYTGTMMWADRDKQLIVVLLTNRVHPSSRSLEILPARAAVCDAIVDILSDQSD